MQEQVRVSVGEQSTNACAGCSRAVSETPTPMPEMLQHIHSQMPPFLPRSCVHCGEESCDASGWHRLENSLSMPCLDT